MVKSATFGHTVGASSKRVLIYDGKPSTSQVWPIPCLCGYLVASNRRCASATHSS